MENNSNLVSIERLRRIAKEKNIMKYIKEINYSKVQNKKYYVITVDNKKINFGDVRYSDFLTNKDLEKRKRFRARFRKTYEKFSDNYNSALFYSWHLLW